MNAMSWMIGTDCLIRPCDRIPGGERKKKQANQEEEENRKRTKGKRKRSWLPNSSERQTFLFFPSEDGLAFPGRPPPHVILISIASLVKSTHLHIWVAWRGRDTLFFSFFRKKNEKGEGSFRLAQPASRIAFKEARCLCFSLE